MCRIPVDSLGVMKMIYPTYIPVTRSDNPDGLYYMSKERHAELLEVAKNVRLYHAAMERPAQEPAAPPGKTAGHRRIGWWRQLFSRSPFASKASA